MSLPKDERFTPPWLVKQLDDEFHFDTDAAAHDLAPMSQLIHGRGGTIWTARENGLVQNWGGKRVFCNPPWSDIGPWAAKAHTSFGAKVIVMLLPSDRTEQPWWQQHVEPFRDGKHGGLFNDLETRFLPKRISDFGSPWCPVVEKKKSSMMHGCCLLIWRAA